MVKGNVCSVCGLPASHVIIREEYDLVGKWVLLCEVHYPKEASAKHYGGFRIREHTCTASKPAIERKGLSDNLVCQTEG